MAKKRWIVGRDVFFILVLIALSLPLYCLVGPRNAISGDFGIMFHGWNANTRALFGGDFPLWYPFVWDGVSSVGYIFQNFYPVSLLLNALFFNADTGVLAGDLYTWYLAVHLVILSCTFYLLLRTIQYRPLPSFVAALCACFSGTVVTIYWPAIFSAISWFPLLLICVYKQCTCSGAKAWLFALATGLVFSLIYLAGGPSMAIFGVLFFAVQLVCFLWKKSAKEVGGLIARAAVAGCIGVGISAIQILPFLEFLTESVRYLPQEGFVSSVSSTSYASFIADAHPISQSYRLVVGLYGLALFVLAMLGLFHKKSSPMLSMARFVYLFSAVVSMGFIIPALLYYIPGFSFVRELFLYIPLAALSAGILAAEGVTFLLDSLRRPDWAAFKGSLWAKPMLVAVLALSAIALLPLFSSTLNRVCWLCLATAGIVLIIMFQKPVRQSSNAYLKKGLPLAFVLLLLGAAALDYASVYPAVDKGKTLSGVRDETTAAIENLEPVVELMTPIPQDLGEIATYRVITWSPGGAIFDDGMLEFYKIPDVMGYINPVLESAVMVHGLDLNKRAVIQNAQYILSWVDAESTAALRETYESYGFTWLGDVEGIRSIDYPNETRGVGVYKTMARGEGWMVYDILSYTDGLGMEEMQDVLSQTDFDPSATAMLGENDFQKLTMPSGENHKGDVKTQSMRVNQTDLSVETSEHGLLATAQINYPGWRVYIDGVYSPHVEINGGFIGVPIEAGTHEVVLRYEPVSFYVGAGVAIGTLGLCGVLAVLLWRRVVKNKRQPACKALEAEGGNQETRQM